MRTITYTSTMLLLLSFITGCVGQQSSELNFSAKTSNKTGGVELNDPNRSKFLTFNKLMATSCVSCHNDTSARKGISLEFTSEAEALASGYIVPGKPSESSVYQALKGIAGASRMPPSAALPSAEIAFVEDYIKSLAPGVTDEVKPATIDSSFTTFDPEKVRLSLICNATGVIDIEIFQKIGAAYVSLKTDTIACVLNEAREKIFTVGSLPGLVSNDLRVVIRSAAQDIGSRDLEKLPSISSMPAIQRRCFAEANYIPKFTLKKLSRVQIENILRDLFAELGVDVTAQIAPLANYLIEDTISTDLISTEFFSKNDLSFSKQNSEGISTLYGQLLASLEAGGPGFKTTIENNCTGLSRSACFELIVDRHLFRLLKGQVPVNLRSDLLLAAQDFSTKYDGIVSLIEAAIVSPYFVFELYATDVTPTMIELTDEELFYKSYLALFDTLPRWQDISDWYLSGQSYSDYVAGRITADATHRTKFKGALSVFFKEWLKLAPDTPFNNSDFTNLVQDRIPAGLQPNFKKNSQNALINSLSTRASNDLLEVRDIHFWDSAAASGTPFEDLLEYDGGGEVPLAVLPPVIFSASNYNNIFARGASVYKRFMCGDFSGLEAPAAVAVEGASAAQTTRGHFEALTPKGSSCWSCHQRFNGLGYNLEEYGVIGERRSDGFEHKYDASGNVTQSLDLNVGGEVSYLNQFYYTPNVNTLMHELDTKGILKRCTTKQLGQYFLRLKNSEENACILEKINRTSSTSVKDIVLEIIASESFRRLRR